MFGGKPGVQLLKNIQKGGKRDKYIQDHPELTKDTVEKIEKGIVAPGMTREMVSAIWGKPIGVDYTEEGDEILFYENQTPGGETSRITKVHFKDGKVLSVKSEFTPHKSDRSWDKFTPQEVY